MERIYIFHSITFYDQVYLKRLRKVDKVFEDPEYTLVSQWPKKLILGIEFTWFVLNFKRNIIIANLIPFLSR